MSKISGTQLSAFVYSLLKQPEVDQAEENAKSLTAEILGRAAAGQFAPDCAEATLSRNQLSACARALEHYLEANAKYVVFSKLWSHTSQGSEDCWSVRLRLQDINDHSRGCDINFEIECWMAKGTVRLVRGRAHSMEHNSRHLQFSYIEYLTTEAIARINQRVPTDRLEIKRSGGSN